MTKSTITIERLEKIKSWRETYGAGSNVMLPAEEAEALALIALAAMDSSESIELPLDYLQGHKDGLEWAARLAEANHPDTGDWLYDDPIELAKAIRKGPDMPPAQSVADSEPVAWTDEEELRDVNDAGIGYLFGIDREANKFADPRRQIMLYRHAQQPVVPEEATSDSIEILASARRRDHAVFQWDEDQRNAAADSWNACRAAILAAAPQSPGSEPATVPGKWIPVSERMPDDDDFVYIWPRPDFGVELHVGQYCECSPKGDGWYAQVYEQNYGIEWHPITVTHWMPLPAGPQGVKGE